MNLLSTWLEAGRLRPLDLALADFIRMQDPQATEPLMLATALVSAAEAEGHLCLDVSAMPEETQGMDWMGAGLEALLRSPAVFDARGQTQPEQGATPLVLGGSHARPLLYLRRYWLCERNIQTQINQRLSQTLPPLNPAHLLPRLEALFPEADSDQKAACALAASQPFAMITGGPGTGKTTLSLIHI